MPLKPVQKVMEMSPSEFFKRQNHMRQWAEFTGCKTMAEIWKRKDLKPEWRLWIAAHGALSDRDARGFGCWCVRQVWGLLPEESRRAVVDAEAYANGHTTKENLRHTWTLAVATAWSKSLTCGGDVGYTAVERACHAAALVSKQEVPDYVWVYNAVANAMACHYTHRYKDSELSENWTKALGILSKALIDMVETPNPDIDQELVRRVADAVFEKLRNDHVGWYI